MDSKLTTSFRIDETLYQKAKIIAKKERRSINSQLEYFVLQCVEQYEKLHGEIDSAADHP